MKNSFVYQVHIKGTIEYQILITKAQNIYIAMIIYSSSQYIFQIERLSFTINSTIYYNTVQYNWPFADDCQTIQDLLVVLADASFLWHSQIKYKEDLAGNVIS